MPSKKRKLAMKMMTQEEIKNHISPFLSKAWKIRVAARLKRELRKQYRKKKTI